MRWTVMVALCTAVACSGGTAEVSGKTAAPEVFAGAWRSVTPTMEFIRLSVHSLSSRQGALGAQLSFSGVQLEGSGEISGDSLVADMSYSGGSSSAGVIVVRSPSAGTLTLRLDNRGGAAPLDLTFVRDP
jgi:hypothetical protein